LGGIVITLLAYVADFRSLAEAFLRVSALDVLILSALSFALIGVSVVKWRAFLRRMSIEARFWRLFGLYLVGYFVNLLMPSYVGGDVVRSMYVGKGVDKSHAVSATMLERYTGMIAMVVMAFVSVWWAPSVTPELQLATIGLALGLVVMSVFARARWSSFILRTFRAPEKCVRLAEKIEGALAHGFSDRALLVKAFSLSFVFHVLTVVNTLAVAYAVGWESVAWRDLLVVVPMILLVGAIPIAPQGLGIQEGAFVFFLTRIGATPAEALAMALILRAKSYILALVGGLMWLSLREEFSPDASSPPDAAKPVSDVRVAH
jgi:uncharacterized protein (TIRG00374 family)